jgi:hypothetical protein
MAQAIGHEKAGRSAVKCFGNLDRAFGLRLWKTHLSKKGSAAKAQPGTYSRIPLTSASEHLEDASFSRTLLLFFASITTTRNNNHNEHYNNNAAITRYVTHWKFQLKRRWIKTMKTTTATAAIESRGLLDTVDRLAEIL